MEKRTMRFSLRTQFTLIIVALLAGMMLVSMLVNRTFLEDYYRTQKITALKKCRERLVEAAGRDEISSDDFDVELVKINNKDNIGIIVMNQDSMTIKSYGPDADTMQRRMWDNLLGLTPTKEELESYADGGEQGEGEDAGEGSTTDEAREFWRKNGMDAFDFCVLETIEHKDNYVLNVILDRKTAQQSLEMWGSLEDGSYFLLRAPLESVHNSSSLANSFFLRVGLVITAIGAVMAMILAGTVTRPIRELTEISTRMKKLDFSAKYEGTSRTEIADLGQNIKDIRRKEEVEAMRQDFLASVTHELKTPLALIQGYAEGLQEGISDDPESRDYYCEVIVDEAGKMNRMVQKLLTLNQLEFGNNAVTMEHFDITELIRNYLSRAALLAEQNGITVSMQETGPIMVWADEFLVEEVFANYYSNACNHAAGDKVVDISFEEKEDTVRVSVFNTGSPIPSGSLPHLWEKFYKVDKARTRAYGGSGPCHYEPAPSGIRCDQLRQWRQILVRAGYLRRGPASG